MILLPHFVLLLFKMYYFVRDVVGLRFSKRIRDVFSSRYVSGPPYLLITFVLCKYLALCDTQSAPVIQNSISGTVGFAI